MADIPPKFIGTNGNVSSYTTSASVPVSVASKEVLAEWEQQNHEGDGLGDDANAIGVQVKVGDTQNGQTAWQVVRNTSHDEPQGTGSPQSSPPVDTGHPAYHKTQGYLADQDYNNATNSFADLFNDSWMNNPNIDINGLIQAVLRNSYEDNQQDLKYQALKVQFYNNLKKKIREELARARQWQATHEKSGPNASDSALTEPYQPGPQWDSNFDGSSTEPVPADQALNQGSNPPDGGTTPAGSPTANPPGTNSTGAPPTTTGSGSGVKVVDPSTVNFQPPLTAQNSSTLDNWKVYETSDHHYIAVNFNGHDTNQGEVRVYGPPGANGQSTMMEQVWGDPHLDGQGTSLYKTPDGSIAAFNDYGQFALSLPDGTQISITTAQTSASVPSVNTVDIISGNDHYKVTSGPNNTGTQATQLNDGSTWLSQNTETSNGGHLFALEDNGSTYVWQDGKWLQVKNQNNAEGSTLQTTGVEGSVTSAQTQVEDTQGNVIATANQLDAYIQQQEDYLQSVGDDAQLAQVDLQNIAQNQQQTMQTLSNLSKSFHDLCMAIIRNISG